MVVVPGDDALGVLPLDQIVQIVVEQIEVVQLAAQHVAALHRCPQTQQQDIAVHREGLHVLTEELLAHL